MMNIESILFHGRKGFKMSFKHLALAAFLSVAFLFGNSQAVHAEAFILPSSYRVSDVRKWHNGRLSSKAQNRLLKASIAGMGNQSVYHSKMSGSLKMIDLRHVSNKEANNLGKYTLSLINQARSQSHLAKWHYDSHAQKVANSIAREYTKHSKSCWDDDHYYAGLYRVNKKYGLYAQRGRNFYEDEAGLPISANNSGYIRSENAIKADLYFNVQQMLYGGYSGNNIKDANRYTEWSHAYDLLNPQKSVLLFRLAH